MKILDRQMQEKRDAQRVEMEENNRHLKMVLDKDERDIKKTKDEKRTAL